MEVLHGLPPLMFVESEIWFISQVIQLLSMLVPAQTFSDQVMEELPFQQLCLVYQQQVLAEYKLQLPQTTLIIFMHYYLLLPITVFMVYTCPLMEEVPGF